MKPFIMMILPMFFALSGFLVAGSLLRTKTLVMFLGLRGIRIFPALGMECLLSALILGPIFTTYSLTQYYSDPLFARYFFNIIGHVQFVLPGVFLDNPAPGAVNAQLWTVPFELACYVALAVLAVVGLVKRRVLVVVAMIGVQVTHLAGGLILHQGDLSALGGGHIGGVNLVVSFLAGVAVYLYRDVLLWDFKTFAVCLVASLLLYETPATTLLAVFPTAYLTVYLGLLNPRKIALMRGADYSYGLYLYGLVVEQALAAVGVRQWAAMTVLTLVLGGLFAAFSWHVVEKPALRLRGPLGKFEERWISRFAVTAVSA